MKDVLMEKENLKIEENKKILPIKYTPDFIGDGFIIECKGRANESFPLRYKLFKKVVNKEQPHVIIYKPQNHKECDKTVELIQRYAKSSSPDRNMEKGRQINGGNGVGKKKQSKI